MKEEKQKLILHIIIKEAEWKANKEMQKTYVKWDRGWNAKDSKTYERQKKKPLKIVQKIADVKMERPGFFFILKVQEFVASVQCSYDADRRYDQKLRVIIKIMDSHIQPATEIV